MIRFNPKNVFVEEIAQVHKIHLGYLIIFYEDDEPNDRKETLSG